MKYNENREKVANLEPDYLCFIFYKKSKRHFEGDIPTLGQGTKKVGVFVNEKLSVINDLIQRFKLDAVQLHGDESPLFCEQLKASNDKGMEVIKAFAVSEDFNFNALVGYINACDYFLFDTKGAERGGNGTLFDWSILEQYPFDKPFFLSGGIGLSQVDQIESFLQSASSNYCYAIDVNSKFESEPGRKKIEELQKFIQLTVKEK